MFRRLDSSIKTRTWRGGAIGLLFLFLLGCGEAGNQIPVGGLIVDDPHDRSSQIDRRAEDEQAEDRDRQGSRRSFWDAEEESSSDRDAEQTRSSRRMPSDSMPSQTEKWGNERKMPSDSMPSQTEKWGSERKMPSDSMPSKTQKWGSERKMPSDNMPSRSFSRHSENEED